MSYIGREIRWERFIYPHNKKGLIVPIDHGFTRGPVPGLESSMLLQKWIKHKVVRGIIAHKGMIDKLARNKLLAGKAIMLHLNGMITTSNNPQKVQLTDVESAIKLGADAVSLDLNFDGITDSANVSLLGQVVDSAHHFGLPVLVMITDKQPSNDHEKTLHRMRHLIRSAMELGADVVKVSTTLPVTHLSRLLKDIADDIPIFFAGGEICSDQDILEFAKRVLDMGAAGMCIGRNIFQKDNPEVILNELQKIIEGYK